MEVDIELIRKGLHQAYGWFGRGPGDICNVPTFRLLNLDEWKAVSVFLLQKGLIKKSIEPEFYIITQTGEQFSYGELQI